MSPSPADLSAALDARLRAATAELLAWQRSAPPAPPADAGAQAADLQAFFDRWGPADATERERVGWQKVIDTLLAQAVLPPQVPLRRQPHSGTIAHDLAALLRPPNEAFDEAQELDWAVRYWEQARQAGLLDDDLAADFGELWRRVEWSGLAQHLTLLAAGHPEEARLLAFAVKVASRYSELAPIKRLLERRWPALFDAGFTLR